jgi:hypothetical protein
VNARGARLDHRLHQLERVQHAAEAGLGVGDDGREEIDVALASMCWIWSARMNALLIRRTTIGTN